MTIPVPQIVPVGSKCPECGLPIDESNPCTHVVHFTVEHGVRCGVVVGE